VMPGVGPLSKVRLRRPVIAGFATRPAPLGGEGWPWPLEASCVI
jgi:hypothetical protein